MSTVIYTFNGKYGKFGNGVLGKVSSGPAPDPYNPLGLPSFTMRFEFYGTDAELDPSTVISNGTWTHVSGSVWDWTYENTSWASALSYWDPNYQATRTLAQIYRFNVLGANTTGVTNMSNLFNNHKYITTIALFDTSSVVNFSSFLKTGSSSAPVLQTIPLFPTSSATNVSNMFENCRNVESGALALYQQMSTQANPPSSHTYTFRYCGRNTTTGAAELAQIPTSWGGTMA